ncbi:MAG TPA: PPOX class F420-dependent oxidoreductase [Dehalococcoidia bacterium]|nr:PPOX class F420-dependent oxidoreductase [Dehalococcoidia bacterium]
MAVPLSEAARALLEGQNFGHLATLMPDGSPQVSPVWVDHDGAHVLVNTAEGRVKLRNVRRDPRVAISIANQQNPYQMVTIQGRVVEITHEGADEHIDKMAKKYLGQDTYPFRRPGERRVILKIAPERIAGWG